MNEHFKAEALKLKILIVSFTFPPNKDGVSEAAAAMALGFVERGWSVDVLTEITVPARESMIWNQIRITEYSHHSGESLDLQIHQSDGSYRDFLINGGWDVVIFHAYLRPLYLALPFLEQVPARKILVSHGYAALIWIRTSSFPYGLGAWIRSVIASLKMSLWLRRFDRTVYLSEQSDFKGFYDHRIAKALNYTGRRVIPNGVNPDLGGRNPNDFRRELGIEDDQPLLLCVANYSDRKDQGYAARAFRAAALSNAVMMFIGSEFNLQSARFQAEDNALPPEARIGRIIWLEKVSRDSTLDALAACDVFVLSANHEAQPIALLEAMREAKPWVARAAGCIPAMPGGICVRSEGEMARQMVRLSENRSLRATLGKQGREAVESTYNIKRYVDSYRALVSEVTEQKH